MTHRSKAETGMGEALTDRQLIEKISIAKKLGFNIHILTNGSLFNKEYIDQLKDMVSDIRISLHTVQEEEYKKITGGSKKQFENVLSMIDYIVEKDIRLILTADVIEENEKEIQTLVNKYEGIVDLIEVWKPHNWGTWGTYRKGEKIKNTCGRPLNGPLQIQVDGTINMCCFDYNGELLLGDFKTQSLNEIFSSNSYNLIKEQHETGEGHNIICDNCDQLYDSGNVIIYNSKFSPEERIGKLSTTYKEV